MKIIYPILKPYDVPTPDKLFICDDCSKALWNVPSIITVICRNVHLHTNGKNRRMRKATPSEIEEAENVLER